MKQKHSWLQQSVVIALLLSVLMIISACGDGYRNNSSDNEANSVADLGTEDAAEKVDGTSKDDIRDTDSADINLIEYQALDYPFGQVLLDNIQSGGVPKDGIPSIDQAIYKSVSDVYDDYELGAQFFLF